MQRGEAIITDSLAQQLDVTVGDTVNFSMSVSQMSPAALSIIQLYQPDATPTIVRRLSKVWVSFTVVAVCLSPLASPLLHVHSDR